MSKKPFISTTFAPDNSSIISVLDTCYEKGITNIELGSNHKFEEDLSKLDSYGFNFLVHNYFPIPRESFVLNIASTDSLIREKSLNHVKRAIDFSSDIGAKLYTFHPGFLTDPKGPNKSSDNYDFQWDQSKLLEKNLSKSRELMFDSLKLIITYASKKSVRIAIESEGSLKKKDHLLMQRPEEYKELFRMYTPSQIGVNLNIGHLNLAAKAFKFSIDSFFELVNDYIVAMELSHNEGFEDQHLPLVKDAWYWKYIFHPNFAKVYKVLEYRNVSMDKMIKSIKLFEDISNDF